MSSPIGTARPLPPVDLQGTRFAEMLNQIGVSNSVWAPMRRIVNTSLPAWWASMVGARAVQVGCACIARATRDPRIGLRLAERINERSLGIIDYLARTARTPRHAFEVIQRFHRYDYIDTELVEDGSCYALELTPMEGLELHPMNVDYRLGRLIYGTRTLLGDAALSPVEIAFSYARPSSTQAYHERFGKLVRLVFDARCSRVVFPAELADRPIVSRDDLLHSILLRQAEELALQLQQLHGPISDKLRELVTTQLEAGKPDSAKAARKLGMSERTLRRRLAEEGESFQGVVDGVRASLAEAYLQNPALSVETTARRLGFDSAVSLRRAFRRWTGKSLREHRQGLEGMAEEQAS